MPGLLQDAADMLSQFGITPTTACNGAEALALAIERRFDLILLDIAMPVMDGLETARSLRQFELEHPERERTTIVAYTTGRLLVDQALQARAGFDAAIRKPCAALQLEACLRRLNAKDPMHRARQPHGASLRARG